MANQGNSREITTNQTGLHDKLDDLVARYQRHQNQRPYSEHTLAAFEQIQTWLGDWQGEIILDSCCGVGESTANLAALYPDAKVIGVDKSAMRVEKHEHYAASGNNYLVVRADVNDLWRLFAEQKIPLVRHFLFYPNPYPKSTQIQKRWYASPATPTLMGLTNYMEVRSNWKLYCEEFAYVAKAYGFATELVMLESQSPMTPFERKYGNSGQACWQLICRRG